MLTCQPPVAHEVTGGGSLSRWRARRALRREHRDYLVEAYHLAARWRWHCASSAVGSYSSSWAGIPGVSVPRVRHVDFRRPDPVLHVELLGGQVAGDIAAEAPRLAEALGVHALRVEPWQIGVVRVHLVSADPLAAILPPVEAIESGRWPLTLGVDEAGEPIPLVLSSAMHLVLQGATGSGKSVAAYSLLGQLVNAVDVEVVGSDPTGLLLGPWRDRTPHLALGTGDAGRHVQVLQRLVAVMDERIARIPAGHDSLPVSKADPLIFAVLEEWPGTLRLLDAVGPKTLGRTARACVARLLSEARKAGIRVLLICQRADATVIGGFERGQASHKLSFRVDNADAVRMLHPDVDPATVAAHTIAEPGIGLLSAPGRPLVRFRGPHMPYAEYVAQVAGRAAA
jgi:S-DNA-T family DNA segregation ATPase FtsK/SpoIIIE